MIENSIGATRNSLKIEFIVYFPVFFVLVFSQCLSDWIAFWNVLSSLLVVCYWWKLHGFRILWLAFNHKSKI
jgi:hypothetical protein